MRSISDSFITDLKHPEGILHPLLERIQYDDTLMLAIREGYINVYYRGGNLVRITEKSGGIYTAFFDTNYNITSAPLPILPGRLLLQQDTDMWVNAFGELKTSMDAFFSQHPKLEREFQQVIARVNNITTLSNSTEYFITDIEFADSALNARFDLMGIRWLASERTNGKKCRVALIEMKYGDGALSGNAGILKHLTDFHALLEDQEKYRQICETIEFQFQRLDELGMFQFNHCTNGTMPQLDPEMKPEVIFLFANHNPRSKKLSTLLNDPAIEKFANSPFFDLQFAVSPFAGYTLHSDCMVSLEEFRRMA